MKTLVKGLTVLLVLGSFMFVNCENAEAADLEINSTDTQELARHHYPPPPPPPHHRHHPPRHHNDFEFYPPPPPPPPHHNDHRPHRRW